ncbi:sterol desaturase/sphingolipid hydroxylase (fatty acid hydroxylase superfamily) [Saonia flava]|uniref:Sterol desaturase/sphingolipid hydroxylase (Fatty acid hydroxylase superfamily) n=1 Tax=Saonia flava TaxID=523696 RepID=A0A846QP98_9FLAO|nr:sterol desaturase family protein [Saonia flava]NJB69891.1 sterol desaturase/sphingolipid hydroxylase (fatty acid hydroxylase superfamily) [Saonia flava]
MPVEELSHIMVWIVTTLLFMLRYLVVAGLFYVLFYVFFKKKEWNQKIQHKKPRVGQIKKEIIYSLGTFIIYGSSILLFLYWIRNGKTKLYTNIDTYGTVYLVLSIVFMVVLHDAYFYWTHRLIHHSKVFKYVHRTHHRFHNPTPWAAFAFHPLEGMLSMGIIPIIIFMVPYHQYALIGFISFMTLYNVFIHLGYKVSGFPYLKYQNTTMDHDYHHHKGHGNYGLYFNVWDKLMGTYLTKKERG